MKQFLSWLIIRLKFLFDFHQPCFRQFYCIDLVLENKLLILLSWDAVHTSKVCIRPGKNIYRRSVSAAICKLPEGTKYVDVVLRNVWRSKKITVQLKGLLIDPQTLRYFEEGFWRGINITPELLHARVNLPAIQLKKPQLQILTPVELSPFNISINHFQLNDYVP